MTTTWLITGCASGIGRSTALLALERGANVVATARSAERLLSLKKHYEGRIVLVDLDVINEHAARAAVEVAVEKFGRLDVLVNSAGYSHLGPFEQKSPAAFRAEVETNFFGVVNLVRAALPIMRRQRSGYIINISSSSARFGGPGEARCPNCCPNMKRPSAPSCSGPRDCRATSPGIQTKSPGSFST
ncbi:SDR family oxidoreductase [Steroidobacter agaridevorans]|uniref:SDR family oxidoreductase n=1 Tax=Steroidobacter agaridevorans TaxID=2695856 RepID=UPI0038D49F77